VRTAGNFSGRAKQNLSEKIPVEKKPLNSISLFSAPVQAVNKEKILGVVFA